jgi:crotonobetaine/carnitine-CoA ligase
VAAVTSAKVIPIAQRTLPQLLQRQAERFGARPFLRIGETEWTHDVAIVHAAARAGALRAAGVGRGDRVAVMCDNCIEFIETVLACGWIGAVVVPVNTALMTAQIDHVLRDSGACLLVTQAAGLERLPQPLHTALRCIWLVGEPDAAAAQTPGVTPWPDAGEPEPPADLGPGDVLAILYTSGTTGAPKGVMCPHAQYVAWGLNTTRVLGLVEADVLCTTLPLFHINALNTYAQAAVTGCRAVWLPRFSASVFWPAMQRERATVIYLLGAMVPILLAQPEGPQESGHCVRIGLGPGVPVASAHTFRARTGVSLLEGYGSTETNFVLSGVAGGPADGTMGQVQPDFHARVVDEHDVELPDGTAGELVVRADEPFAFAVGYWGLPQQTVQAWRNLWFHTGDRVVREPGGRFRFVDRLKDAIRRRGENISSWEVEQVLQSYPSIAEVAVFPVGSELAEDEVMAALIARAGHVIDLPALWAFCDQRLPRFAVPRYLDLVDDLPRTANGKVRKFVLRERGVTAVTRDRLAAAPPLSTTAGKA